MKAIFPVIFCLFLLSPAYGDDFNDHLNAVFDTVFDMSEVEAITGIDSPDSACDQSSTDPESGCGDTVGFSDGGTITMTSTRIVFKPKKDITTYELALVVQCFA